MEHKYIRQEPINVKRLESEIGTLSTKTIGYKHLNGVVTVYVNSVLTAQEISDLGTFINNHDGTPDSELRIFRLLPKDQNPLISDFTILGFRKRAPHYDRGRKTKAEYRCAINDEIIVEKIFMDVRDPTTNLLTGLQVTFNWYNEDNEIGLTKTEIVKELNKAQAETIERQRRERAIDFLISEARNTPNEPYINTLMLHYDTEILHFKDKASNEFATAINNETDPTISAILAARVPFASDTSYTVPIKESILYQIGSLDEAGLLATLQPV